MEIASPYPNPSSTSYDCKTDYSVNFAVNYTDANCSVNFAENFVDSLLAYRNCDKHNIWGALESISHPRIFLILDQPALAARFRDLILAAMLGIARILDEEAGFAPEDAPRGFYWCDDNCAMLTADMYEFFGYPILKGIFDRYAPDERDMRGQHSDSDMAHLLPILGRLNLTAVNFGPKVMVDEIRAHLPHAVIHGQLAPFTFSRNEEVNIVAEFLRDFELAREKKGLVFATAGSINNGSRLTGLRLIMAAIQEYGRY